MRNEDLKRKKKTPSGVCTPGGLVAKAFNLTLQFRFVFRSAAEASKHGEHLNRRFVHTLMCTRVQTRTDTGFAALWWLGGFDVRSPLFPVSTPTHPSQKWHIDCQ